MGHEAGAYDTLDRRQWEAIAGQRISESIWKRLDVEEARLKLLDAIEAGEIEARGDTKYRPGQ